MLKIIVPLSICWILIFTMNPGSADPNLEQINTCYDKCKTNINNIKCCEDCFKDLLDPQDKDKAIRQCIGF